jgi:hypothetical protein
MKKSFITDEDKEDLKSYHYLMKFFEEEIPKNAGAMFYFTLTYEGDLEQRNKMLDLKVKLESKNLI